MDGRQLLLSQFYPTVFILYITTLTWHNLSCCHPETLHNSLFSLSPSPLHWGSEWAIQLWAWPGPLSLMPAPARCRDILANRDDLSRLGRGLGEIARDRPGPVQIRVRDGETTRKRGFGRCCEEYSLIHEWWSHFALFQISLNDSVFLLIMGGAHKLINTSAQNLFPNVL